MKRVELKISFSDGTYCAIASDMKENPWDTYSDFHKWYKSAKSEDSIILPYQRGGVCIVKKYITMYKVEELA